MMKPSTNGIITGGVVTLFVTMGIILFISIRQSEKVKDTAQRVNQTQEAIRHAQNLVMTSLDNETGARGYAITGDESFLEPLYRSVYQFEQEMNWIRTNAYRSEDYARIVDSLDRYIRARIQFSDSMVSVRRNQGLGAIIAMVREGVGKSYTDSIRHLGNRLVEAETQALEKRKKANEDTIGQLNRILFGVLGIVFVLSLYSLYNLRADIRKKEMSERKFRALLDSAPDATVIVDEEGSIRMINQQTERLFGYTKEELLGKKVELLIPGNLREKHTHHRRKYIDQPRVRMMGEGIELMALKKDGGLFPVAISLSPIRTEEGMMVSASVRDITGSKELENNLRRSNEELEAFTYSVSHDLRAPLRGITGFTTILENEYGAKLDEEARRITGVIKNNALRMGNLIDDLLAFSRMGRKEMAKVRVDMERMVKELAQEYNALENDRKIHWTIEPLPMVMGDPSTLRQVWINLISNAVKYTGKKERPEIHIGHYVQGRQQVYFIRDNGVGFNSQYRDKLFKVFQRLHSHVEFEGTGVGLALVQKIILRHGGNTWAEGETEKGASFYFSIPIES
ncbi:MAG: PAS domain S-box protein [Chitinophagaceae bacterium]|nr:PAS domain S-box protein [Chitinophagaceae bacterium]